jgi:hypothetical protein
VSGPFRPRGDTVTVSASTTSAQGTFSTARDGGYDTCRVYNATDAVAFVAFGDNPTAAAATSLPMAPQSIETFEVTGTDTKIAVILSTGTGSVYATMGKLG